MKPTKAKKRICYMCSKTVLTSLNISTYDPFLCFDCVEKLDVRRCQMCRSYKKNAEFSDFAISICKECLKIEK